MRFEQIGRRTRARALGCGLLALLALTYIFFQTGVEFWAIGFFCCMAGVGCWLLWEDYNKGFIQGSLRFHWQGKDLVFDSILPDYHGFERMVVQRLHLLTVHAEEKSFSGRVDLSGSNSEAVFVRRDFIVLEGACVDYQPASSAPKVLASDSPVHLSPAGRLLWIEWNGVYQMKPDRLTCLRYARQQGIDIVDHEQDLSYQVEAGEAIDLETMALLR